MVGDESGNGSREWIKVETQSQGLTLEGCHSKGDFNLLPHGTTIECPCIWPDCCMSFWSLISQWGWNFFVAPLASISIQPGIALLTLTAWPRLSTTFSAFFFWIYFNFSFEDKLEAGCTKMMSCLKERAVLPGQSNGTGVRDTEKRWVMWVGGHRGTMIGQQSAVS